MIQPLLVAALLAAGPIASPAGAPKMDFTPPDEAAASVRWNVLARSLVLHGRRESFQTFASLSLAQLRAAQAAEPERAVIDVSALLLEQLFPAEKKRIEAQRAAELHRLPTAAKEVAVPTVGTQTVETIIEPWKIVRDILRVSHRTCGSGVRHQRDPHATWTSAPRKDPIGERFPQLCPLALSGELPKSPQPPLLRSREFHDAMAAVVASVKNATPEQRVAIGYWAATPDGEQTPARWNAIADALLIQHHTQELPAAQTLERLNAAMHDTAIACFTEKYSYMTARPTQVELWLKPLGPVPNFPSYPSAHACFSGAAAGILAAQFPQDAEWIDKLADESTASRMWAGLHYSFDGTAGLALGHEVAKRVLDRGPEQAAQPPQ
jgi:hypothetical protein